jgi:hypothetical protein
MQRGKFLYTQKIKDHKSNGNDVDLSVFRNCESGMEILCHFLL